MMKTLRPAILLYLCLTLITGIAYPLLVLGIAQVTFPDQANGSLIYKEGKAVGSALIGQGYSQPGFFWGRPSATTTPYDASASSGSNLGPLNPALHAAVQERIAAYRAADPGEKSIPVDLVTASSSGLDPDISLAGALYQVPRVARTRELAQNTVESLVRESAIRPLLPGFGEPRVNVLKLNLALDALR